MAEEARISVSEDKLYRALGELELRLIKSITDALDKKANASVVEGHEIRLQTLEKSRSERAHIEADVKDHNLRLDVLERAESDRKVAAKTLKVLAVGGALGLLSFVGELFVAIYYGNHIFG